VKKLFGTDGIRGIVGTNLDYNLSYRVGLSLSELLISQGIAYPQIIVGMDTRDSSPMLCSALSNGIREGGGRAINIDVCSTPAIAYHLVKGSFDAGVMISASHNSYEYNGIKIFGSNGYKIPDEMEEQLERLICKEEITPESARKEYINSIKNAFDLSLDGLRIAIDCANGSASVTAKEIFSSLGAECYMLSDSPDGKNINLNCGSTHLDSIKKVVISNKLDVGIAFDGDGDRCIAIDETGREIDGDFILAILSQQMKEEGKLKNSSVVGTVMTNLGLIKFLNEQGIAFECSAVGDRFVLEMLRDRGFSLGGEQSGHIILPDYATTGDGQLTALALLYTMKKNGKSLSSLADLMKKYPQKTVNIDASHSEKAAITQDENILQIIKEQEEALNGRGRLVVRPSGTEPLIRISVESETDIETELICKNLAEKIKGRLNELKTTV